MLVSLEEKKRKEMLDKLLKTFPKSSELNKKIIILINKKSEAKKDTKSKSTFSEINQKNTNTKNPQATMGKKHSKKDENKNTKSD